MNIIIYNENTTLYLEDKIKKINNKYDIKGTKKDYIKEEVENLLNKNFKNLILILIYFFLCFLHGI